MKKLLSILMALVLVLSLGVCAFASGEATEEATSEGGSIVLKGAKLLDAYYNGQVLDVLVKDGVITAVGKDLTGDTVIDLTGCTLMPGMIDAHVHVAGSSGYGIDEAGHTPSDEMSGALIDGMVENAVAMNTSGAESYEDIKIANLKAFYDAGGIITVGTDLMRNYDNCMVTLTAEMAVLAKAGLSVQEVITCATRNNARALEIHTGEIAVGFEADFLAVEGGVDETFAALCDAAFVMNDGVVIVE